MTDIRHIWFDLEGTLTIHTPEWDAAHDALLLKTYADAVGKPATDAVWKEYQQLYARQGTNSAAFQSLGLPSDYWQRAFGAMDEATYYKPDKRVYGTLQTLQSIVPISLFSNAKPLRIQKTLEVIGVDPAWFTHTLSGDDVAARKPDLQGFHKMVETTGLTASQILYVGDRVKADILPAKAVGMQTALVWSVDNQADYSFLNFEDLLTVFSRD